jgi:hypothetical protein
MAISDALGAKLNFTSGRLGEVRNALLPMWQSLAKNEHGRIDRRSLRYAMHRYLMHSNSISVLGLEPLRYGSSASFAAALFTDHAPAFVKRLVEGGDGTPHPGFSLEDAAAMAVMHEDLVTRQNHGALERIYRERAWDLNVPLLRSDVAEVLQQYLVRWMLSGNDRLIRALEKNRKLLPKAFEHWEAMSEYAVGSLRAFEHAGWKQPTVRAVGHGAWSPLAGRFSFEDVQAITGSMTLSFGRFWASECVRVKESLLRLDHAFNGRVLLSDFHGAALQGEWRFKESASYLRSLGALDDSPGKGPSVIVANYLQGASNCIVTEEHYRVCCVNECEAHLSDIERAVESPTATPDQIVAVVGNISDLDDSSLGLSTSLESQLREIARLHKGRVPLHGRLFALWLHYVFPHDCSFPYRAGTVTDMAPEEYSGYIASAHEMESNAETDSRGTNASAFEGAPLEEGEALQWQWNQEEEELVAEHWVAPWESRGASPSGVAAASVAAVLLLGAKLAWHADAGSIRRGGISGPFAADTWWSKPQLV